jgi:hypothetical protein
MKLKDAAEREDYFFMWAKAEHLTVRQWTLVRFQPNIGAAGLNPSLLQNETTL